MDTSVLRGFQKISRSVERVARLNVYSPSPSHSERFGGISFCPDPCKVVRFHMPSSARAARENRLLANVTFPSREAPGTGSMTVLFI